VSRPEDVSAEAWAAAEAAWEELTHVPIDRDAETVVIARAITAAVAAEREACAVVAEEIGAAYGEDETGWLDCTETVALGVRTRGQP